MKHTPEKNKYKPHFLNKQRQMGLKKDKDYGTLVLLAPLDRLNSYSGRSPLRTFAANSWNLMYSSGTR